MHISFKSSKKLSQNKMVEESIQATIRTMRKNDVEEKPLWKVCCDLLRALLLLQGVAWQRDLVNELRDIWTWRNWEEDKIRDFSRFVKDAIKVLKEKDILDTQRRKRARLAGAGIMEETFYSLKHHALVRRCFADDRDFIRLELSRRIREW
jgi:hypothetical protein